MTESQQNDNQNKHHDHSQQLSKWDSLRQRLTFVLTLLTVMPIPAYFIVATLLERSEIYLSPIALWKGSIVGLICGVMSITLSLIGILKKQKELKNAIYITISLFMTLGMLKLALQPHLYIIDLTAPIIEFY